MAPNHTPHDDGYGSCSTCNLPVKHPCHQTVTLPPVDRNEARVGVNHPATAHAAAARALPRTGTLKRRIFEEIAGRGVGATDDELEQALNRTHQSVSASRNSLMNDGWIEPLKVDGDTVTRRTRTGNDAIAWTPTPAARMQAR